MFQKTLQTPRRGRETVFCRLQARIFRKAFGKTPGKQNKTRETVRIRLMRGERASKQAKRAFLENICRNMNKFRQSSHRSRFFFERAC